MLYRDVLSGRWANQVDARDHRQTFWEQMHKTLQHLYGRPVLSKNGGENSVDDLLKFLYECSADNFLDFLELSFKLDVSAGFMDNDFVESINDIMRIESSPYRLTKIVGLRNERTTYLPNPLASSFSYPPTVTALPKVFLVDDEVVHQEAIQPALSILGAPHFQTANSEFLEALKDYREGEYSDCLTKCGSSFESVMKVICARNGWSYKESDTARPLLATIVSNSNLESFFEQPLLLIATMRNRLSSSHGAGGKARTVGRHVAQYAVASTAAAIVLLVKETG